MSYRFKLTNGNVILNFSEEFYHSPVQLVQSDGFYRMLKAFINYGKEKESDVYLYLHARNQDDTLLIKDLRDLARLLMIMNTVEVIENYEKYAVYFDDIDMFYNAIERFYLYWRRHQRYAVVFNDHRQSGFQNVGFADAQAQFEALILQTYRQIEETALGHKNQVYRQITAGVNAGLVVSTMRSTLPYEYRALDEIPFIENIIIHPPFITYSKRNKRDGIFPEVYENPLEDKAFDPEEWFCYPAKVGDLIAYIYFNVQYMAQGITLCNLFELADETEYRHRKPDLLYIYGYDDQKMNQCFYQDIENDMMVGFLSLDEAFDYFGYMKKMVLTLHNVKKLNQKELPIHGAMVEITLHDGEKKNIVIMGDSGAGKSETIEQIKGLGQKSIREIKTIYDDMGLLSKDEDGNVVTSGTEIGAFVRLDDLDAGYGYKELDRSIFMNPDKINARIVIPITSYRDVVAKHPVDYFFYANNYDNGKEAMVFFDTVDDALTVFRKGARMAKGTTTEMGLVESYFANPFGPVQRQEQTEPILQDYFASMFNQGVKVGQIRTRLGIRGQEHQGPKSAAKAILKLITDK